MNNRDILDLILKRREVILKSNQAEKDFFEKVQENSKVFIDLLKELQMQQIQVNTSMYDVFCSQFVRVDGGVTILFTTKDNGKILIRDISVSMVPTESVQKKKKNNPEPKKRPPFIEATLEGYSQVPDENKGAFLDIVAYIIKNKDEFLKLERDTIKSFYETEVSSQEGQLASWRNRLKDLD